MNDTKTFKLSWHYSFIIVPLILIGTIMATHRSIEFVFIYKIYTHKALAVVPISIFIWFNILTMPFKIQVTNRSSIIASSLLRKTEFLIGDVDSINKNHFSYRVNFGKQSIKISNLMDNVNQLIALLSGENRSLNDNPA